MSQVYFRELSWAKLGMQWKGMAAWKYYTPLRMLNIGALLGQGIIYLGLHQNLPKTR